MNKMTEEEIIDILENVIIFKNTSDKFTDLDLNAIQGLLDLYNKQKEKLKAYEIKKENVAFVMRQYGKTNNIIKEYISKDKIREKIKELKKECIDCSYRKMLNCKKQCTIGGTTKVLKELLNEEGDPDAK